MDKNSVVASIFSKLSDTFAQAGMLVTDEDKATEIAKLLGLVKGIRKVGGLTPTDEGYVFAGVDPHEIERAKESAAVEAKLAALQAKMDALKAKAA
jgi:hypothetical protein